MLVYKDTFLYSVNDVLKIYLNRSSWNLMQDNRMVD